MKYRTKRQAKQINAFGGNILTKLRRANVKAQHPQFMKQFGLK